MAQRDRRKAAIVSTVTMEDVYYDPYDRTIDTDPYPVWRRLRD